MKKIVLGLMIVGIFAVFMTSCDNDKFKTNENGLKYKFHSENKDGKMPEEGNIIEVNMSYAAGDSVLFDSKDMPQAMVMRMEKPLFKGDLYEGVYMMHVGDSATFACNTDSVFKILFRQHKTPEAFDSIDAITFNIKLLSVKTQEELQAEQEALNAAAKAEESINRDKYLSDNNITVEPTESGLIFIETKSGKGKKPVAGDKVKVHYTGYLLDGTKFDSSVDRDQPFIFDLGQGRVIKGWDEGIAMMNIGDKATLIIPSSIGYGARGAGGLIPPFSTLVFDVELLGIEK